MSHVGSEIFGASERCSMFLVGVRRVSPLRLSSPNFIGFRSRFVPFFTRNQRNMSAAAVTTATMSEKKIRESLEDVLTRRFFFVPSFEIYGGVGGLYDFGPPGCAIKAQMMDAWRQHFVLEENMLEVSCAAMTPEVVLKTSGHVDRFTDYMVKDEKTGDCYRADKLLEETIDKLLSDPKKPVEKDTRLDYLTIKSAAGSYKKEALDEAFKRFNIKAPDTGNTLTPSFAFNLMFVTSIGPTGKLTGFLRPETAQGIFVNFRRLLDFNAGRMPFAAAQIGLAFRNEIAPRSGLLRVREFPLAEIEHFVSAKDKSHPRFSETADDVLRLLPREDQVGEETPRVITVRDAVKNGVINNETLAYYMARTALFLKSIGIRDEKLRFRQHKSDEMAHYAADCWDAEIYMNGYGWIECVGHADRSAFDLTMHSNVSKVELIAHEIHDPPIVRDVVVPKLNNALIGKTFGKLGQEVMKHLRELDVPAATKLVEDLKAGPVEIKVCDATYKIEPTMYSMTVESKKISTEKYVPSVIEPSFGLGRILYGVLDHSFQIRDGDEKKVVLSLPPLVAPTKVSILPLSNNSEFDPFLTQLTRAFTKRGISSKCDQGAVSIGRRYARADEVGTSYAVTIDFDTVKDKTLTIRDRDTTQQVRVTLDQAVDVVADLSAGKTTWSKVYESFPKVTRTDAENDA